MKNIESWLKYSMPNAKYHAAEGCSSSWLKRAVLKSPAHADIPIKTTDQMRLGTAVHGLCLEPEQKNFLVAPYTINRRTKVGREEYAELEDRAELLKIPLLSSDVADTAKRMRDAVFNHPEAHSLLHGGQPEFTVFSEIDGYTCKARVDYRRVFSGTIGRNIELKTCADASPDGFRRQFENMLYDLSVAWYERVLAAAGLETDETMVIAVENTPPYGVRVMRVSDELKERGWQLSEIGFEMWKERELLGESIGYPTGIDILEPSKWAWNILKGRDQ